MPGIFGRVLRRWRPKKNIVRHFGEQAASSEVEGGDEGALPPKCHKVGLHCLPLPASPTLELSAIGCERFWFWLVAVAATATTLPLKLLSDLAIRSRSHHLEEPSPTTWRSLWRGVVFRPLGVNISA